MDPFLTDRYEAKRHFLRVLLRPRSTEIYHIIVITGQLVEAMIGGRCACVAAFFSKSARRHSEKHGCCKKGVHLQLIENENLKKQ